MRGEAWRFQYATAGRGGVCSKVAHNGLMHRLKPNRVMISLGMVAVILTGCASVDQIPLELERIIYAPSGGPFCFDNCVSETITVAADGRIWIENGRWADNAPDWRERTEEDWRTTTRLTRSSPEVYARLRDRLAPYKPASQVVLTQAGENCVNFVYDQGEVRVTWVDPTGEIYRIFESGCVDDRGLNDAVDAAFDALPVRR